MYVNDIGLNIHGEIRLFADDIFCINQLEHESDWKMTFNTKV